MHHDCGDFGSAAKRHIKTLGNESHLSYITTGAKRSRCSSCILVALLSWPGERKLARSDRAKPARCGRASQARQLGLVSTGGT